MEDWPAVIFAQAIDYSHYQRYPEIQRRFIITNPKMTTEKYAAAINLIFDKFGLPDFAYQLKVVSDHDKQKVKQIILDIKEKMLDICDRILPGANNVFVPFSEVLEQLVKKERAFDMTAANRFGTFLTLLPLVNIDKKPRIVVRLEGSPIWQTIPFALFEDLRESMFLMEYAGADGVRPYILEWYHDVFLVAYYEAKERDLRSKVLVTNKNSGEQVTISENIIALTTDDLVEKTREVYKRTYTKGHIRDAFIYPLMNSGYVDYADSEIDKRTKIYYPLIILEDKDTSINENKRLQGKINTCNLFQQSKIYVENTALYPNKQYIISKIQALLKCTDQNPLFKQIKILDHEGQEIESTEELVLLSLSHLHSNVDRLP
jgi:hypothetical protein